MKLLLEDNEVDGITILNNNNIVVYNKNKKEKYNTERYKTIL
jgi:hypothetical protein